MCSHLEQFSKIYVKLAIKPMHLRLYPLKLIWCIPYSSYCFCKAVLIFKFHLLVFVCMYAIFLIINTSFLIYLYNDYFPFSLKATYCTLILHDSMVFFGSLTFLFFFYFQGVQCMPEFG